MRTASSTARPSRVARTVRRRLRRGAVVVALAALGLGGAAAVAPAQAAGTRPAIRAVAGDGMLTATWGRVSGATGYTVRVSARKSLAHARVLHVTSLTAAVRRLANGHDWFVSVRAEPASLAPASRVVAVTTHRGVPKPVSAVRVTPGAAPNTVTATWTGGTMMRKVGLLAASNVKFDQRVFHSAWYPATTRSITLTVPTRYRAFLGAGTGNPIHLRVVQSNSGSTTFHSTYDYTDKYRASPVGSWTFAKAAAAGGATSTIRVAELNTQSVRASEAFTAEHRWSARLPRVARLIESADPDVVLTAELSTQLSTSDQASCSNSRAEPYRCKSKAQYQQLARSLPTLRLASDDAYERALDLMGTDGGSTWFSSRVTDGAHVLYNPDTLTLVDHGYLSPALAPSDSFGSVTGLGVPGWRTTAAVGADRWLSWAELRTKDAAQRTFLAVAVHYPVGDSQAVVDVRHAEAVLAVAAVDRLSAERGGIPVVFGGDFNDDAIRSPKAVQPVLIRDGWFDAAAVPASKRTNIRYSTTNDAGPQTGTDQGYPLRPNRQSWPTSRIDYIMLKGSPHSSSYQNVLRRTASGAFDPDLQGSDHNMQLAVVGIGDPAP